MSHLVLVLAICTAIAFGFFVGTWFATRGLLERASELDAERQVLDEERAELRDLIARAREVAGE